MSKYVLSLLVKPKLKIFCLLCATDCHVLEVKGKINVSLPSDVINRSLTSGVCWLIKDSILGMLNALIRVYINFRFRWANRWLENSFWGIFSTWLVLIKTSFNTFVLKYLSNKPFVLPYSHKCILEFITFSVAYFWYRSHKPFDKCSSFSQVIKINIRFRVSSKPFHLPFVSALKAIEIKL